MNNKRYKTNKKTEKQNPDSLEDAREAALMLLDYQDRTRSELIGRLEKKGFSREVAETVSDSLESGGLIDDERYARLFIETKAESQKGRMWIRNKLREKGIADGIIQNSLEDIFSDEDERYACVDKALSICGLSDRYLAERQGDELYIVPRDGEAVYDEKEDYFSSRCDESETDRRVIYKEREKQKSSLARKLVSSGFSSSLAFYAVKKIDEL